MGRMLRERSEAPRKLLRYGFTVNRYFDLRSEELLGLTDKSHGRDVVFEFHATPLLNGIQHDVGSEQGRLIIPQSAWLDCLKQIGLDRYEFIVVRIPVSSSHLHQPFVNALTKIREAEKQYTKGDWNGAAASCRSAWNTVMFSVQQAHPAIRD